MRRARSSGCRVQQLQAALLGLTLSGFVLGSGCARPAEDSAESWRGGTSGTAAVSPSGGSSAPSSGGGAAGAGSGGTSASATGGRPATAGASGNTGGGPSGGAPSGGAPSGGAPSGGAPSAGGPNAGAPSSGGVSAGGAAGAGPGGIGAGGAPTASVTVFLAGDSTVATYAANRAPQAGWGQLLPGYLIALAKVDNRAIGGRTSRRFISEGLLDDILSVIAPNDYLLIQFGHNDGNQTATYDDGMPYYVAPADFEGYIEEYIAGARDKGAIPVLVTPPPRRSCDTADDSRPFGNGLGGYATAMKNVAARTGSALIDLNQATLDYLNSIGCAASAQVYLVLPAGMYPAFPDGVSDGTHFQETGANKLARFVAEGARSLELPLTAYLK